MRAFVRQQEKQSQQRFETWLQDALRQSAATKPNQLSATVGWDIPPSTPVSHASSLCENVSKTEYSQPAAQTRSNHNYHEPFADPQMERLAQQVYVETNPNGLSICNARRLIVTYGSEVVGKVLQRMLEMQKQKKIHNPAGFLVTASRIEWRVQHGAIDLGAPAPHFRGEPQAERHRNSPPNF
jgi:hypothetical protein